MINFSIIIPHYNIPDLLIRCLKSIPVRDDIQVIVVDDCSPDVDTYKDRYPELSRPYLEMYSTPIGGSAGRARNVGLDHAKGKWLIFADADDFFVDNVVELFDKYKSVNEEIVYFNINSVYSNDITKHSNRAPREFIKKYIETKDRTVLLRDDQPPWGKIISRALVSRLNARFDETKYYNDYFFSITTGFNAESVKATTEILYVVTFRNGSLDSNSYSHAKQTVEECKCRLEVCLKVFNYLNDNKSKFINSSYCRKRAKIYFRNYPLRFLLFFIYQLIRSHHLRRFIFNYIFKQIYCFFNKIFYK